MDNLDLIEKYFENSLTEKEQALFDDLLKNNQNFQDEFNFQKDLKKVITVNQRESLKSTLQGFEKKLRKTRVIQLKHWAAAASVILILGLGYLIFQTSFNNSSEKIYADYFEPYRNIIHPVVRGERADTIEAIAFAAYENGKYYKAINLFNSVENTDADYIKFYEAMCYLKLNKIQEAIDLLLPIATSSNMEESRFNFKQKANWYLGLAYLKNGERNKAISQFSILANYPEDVYKKEKAKIILERLD
ncbi:MAG: CDC27 family protein [Bacteroidota bacterium]